MSWLSYLRERLFAHQVNENDAPADTGVAASRDTGGRAGDPTGDGRSTTGTAENETFVGRVSGGDDEGYAGETGAEARRTD